MIRVIASICRGITRSALPACIRQNILQTQKFTMFTYTYQTFIRPDLSDIQGITESAY